MAKYDNHKNLFYFNKQSDHIRNIRELLSDLEYDLEEFVGNKILEPLLTKIINVYLDEGYEVTKFEYEQQYYRGQIGITLSKELNENQKSKLVNLINAISTISKDRFVLPHNKFQFMVKTHNLGKQSDGNKTYSLKLIKDTIVYDVGILEKLSKLSKEKIQDYLDSTLYNKK